MMRLSFRGRGIQHPIPIHSYVAWNSCNNNQLIYSTPNLFDKVRWHSKDTTEKIKTIPIVFIEKDGTEVNVKAAEGQTILEVAHENEIDLEGACEASLACSTCHVILEPEVFDTLPEAVEEEEDMLDLAFGLTDTSRLGCQVIITSKLAGMKVQLPQATRNMADLVLQYILNAHFNQLMGLFRNHIKKDEYVHYNNIHMNRW